MNRWFDKSSKIKHLGNEEQGRVQTGTGERNGDTGGEEKGATRKAGSIAENSPSSLTC